MTYDDHLVFSKVLSRQELVVGVEGLSDNSFKIISRDYSALLPSSNLVSNKQSFASDSAQAKKEMK